MSLRVGSFYSNEIKAFFYRNSKEKNVPFVSCRPFRITLNPSGVKLIHTVVISFQLWVQFQGRRHWHRSRRPRWGGSPQCSRSPTASWYWPQGLKRLQSRDSFMESEQLTDIFVKSILIYWLYCILIRSTLWGRHITCRVIKFEVRETKRSCDSTFRQEYNFHVLNEHMIFFPSLNI